MTADDLARRLGLQPHPEGGYYRENYRSDETVEGGALPVRYRGNRTFCTAIYYLLTDRSFSAMHRVASDEVFHFYCGDPVEMLQLGDGGSGKRYVMGTGLDGGMVPQLVVPRGVWQGTCLVGGGSWALMGATVAPGFEFRDFELARRSDLLEKYPAHEEMIMRLTR